MYYFCDKINYYCNFREKKCKYFIIKVWCKKRTKIKEGVVMKKSPHLNDNFDKALILCGWQFGVVLS